MNDQTDPLTFTRFIDWCHDKDSLSAEAKRTVEALLYQLEGHLWADAQNANEALWLEWKEWKSKRAKHRCDWESLCNCELADHILSTCYFLETRDWGGYSFQLTDLRPLMSNRF
jgi:hypothetical protein